MQLTGKASIRGALTVLTATLLGSGAVQAVGENQLESSILLYSETDRVNAAEGIVSYSRALKGNRILNARLTFDALTGASPSGATPSGEIQTYTRPSGNGTYTVTAGEIPLDDTFRDTRFSFDAGLTQPLNRETSLVFGTHVSGEHDYFSLGGNIGFTRDFNRRNTTLSASVAYSHDAIRPEGGAPVPLASMVGAQQDDSAVKRSDDSKDIFDLVVGVTQIVDRQTVLRLNYSFDYATGYLNDPYKILSVVQSASGANPGEPVDFVFESRPDSRTKHALFAEGRRYLGGHTVNLSYRYFWDSWGVNSHTVDLHYRLPLKSGHALQPHVRWYKQTAADFYQTYLVDGSPMPTNATADYRLGSFHAITLGLQYLFPVVQGAHLSIGAEYYGQAGDVSPPTNLGPLSQYDLFPDMDAIMIRVGFTSDF